MTKINVSLQRSRSNTATQNRQRPGVMLMQQQCTEINENLVSGDDGRVFDIIYYNCNKRGHYASNFPGQANRVSVSNLQYGHLLSQIKEEKGLIPHGWILLDTCSTDNIINNRNLVNGITSCITYMQSLQYRKGLFWNCAVYLLILCAKSIQSTVIT